MCPLCGSIIEPFTIGFLLCKFKISGKKMDNFFNVSCFENPIGEVKDNHLMKYFDPDLNGETTLLSLDIEILEYY